MQNVAFTISPDKRYLDIRVDLHAPKVPSATGKTLVLASTRGNATVPTTDVQVGLNVYTKSR